MNLHHCRHAAVHVAYLTPDIHSGTQDKHFDHESSHLNRQASMEDVLIQVAETLQTASINRAPSPEHDINPSTAASRKEPVQFESSSDRDDVLSDTEEADPDGIPESVLRPAPRTAQLPPLPDLRFEQSYLASIQHADTWQKIAYITFKDQVSCWETLSVDICGRLTDD